ncbi:hypothetical protein B0A48_18110 [Cryoendolithus antarcticus]|uniref:endo-1,3(4)-beta-glucanase n=1 Tax=Cryoendolithus antarcticus TaxID=1507870 RepID=A0A1V8S9H6_9PEZI|nr:hypothetical protein B0A48_18110 [Cryoendolithus antarcticus]
MHFSTLVTSVALMSTTGWAQYVLEDDFMADGKFFDQFSFFTAGDPTHGFVDYIDQSSASDGGLINVTSSSVYMGVDYTNVATSAGRQSVRITSNKSYNSGLVILDLEHMPGGICGTWPAFWMVGPDWPSNGEIDIIEGVNDQSVNDMTLHTGPGCTISDNGGFSGEITTKDCDVNAAGQDTNAGCQIKTDDTNTYGSGFNANKGGVYATEWTESAISIFFFPRGSIPSDISGGSPDPSGWGKPLASFQGGCDISSMFKEQQIVFDTTFCGDWAGNTWSSSSCSSKAATCNAFVQNNPSAFADAYWTVNSLKVYQAGSESSSTAAPSSTVYSAPMTSTIAVSTTSTVAEPTSIPVTSIEPSVPVTSVEPPAPTLQPTTFASTTKPAWSSRTWTGHHTPVMRNASVTYSAGNATDAYAPTASGTATGIPFGTAPLGTAPVGIAAIETASSSVASTPGFTMPYFPITSSSTVAVDAIPTSATAAVETATSASDGITGSREFGAVDSYSSSRDYREREREDRYSGGGRDRGSDRRPDRDYDRRAVRRDDDDRRRDTRRGDRDLFDDRRRGGARDGARDDRRGGDQDRDRTRALERDDMKQLEQQSRQKSASPERKPKEPTPDLTDVAPVTTRKRRLNQWDIKPPGYENVTAEQAKLSGMFPLPGAPRQQPMDPSRLQAFMAQPGNQANPNALKPSTARQSKRLFVYNLPATATDDSVSEFFNLQLNGLNVTRGADPCISAQMNKGSGYALLEFKTSEDATNAMALNGITMEPEAMDTTNGATNGDAHKGLDIRRPKDYIVPAVTDETANEAGILSNIVPDTQNKISITNIPLYLDEAQMQELLQSFGELKSFILVKDTSSEQSRGIAFCEYMDPSVTDAAVDSLHGMELGDAALRVKRASIGIQQVNSEMSVNAMSLIAGTELKEGADTGRVLCLMNMITPEELMDAEESEEILEDIKEECSKYGNLLETKMPRGSSGNRQAAGIGKIYVKYEDAASAQKALAALAGRKFADRTVVVTYFGEEYFDVGAW